MSAVPAQARQATEGGLLDHRCHVAREDSQNRGQPPAAGQWRLFSDNMVSIFNWEPDGNVEGKRGVGSADVEQFYPGPEDHEASFTYHLQRWFVDAGGNPLDPAYDGLFRDEDNRLPNTHTVVDRELHHTGGSMGAGTKIFTVGLGGKIDTVSGEGEADESLPMEFELEYVFEKVRSYVVHRLDAAARIFVRSTDAADTTQTVTIESEGGAQSETVSLNGTADVLTTTAFTDIDAVWVNSETAGDVEVYTSDGVETTTTTSPAPDNVVTVIDGRTSHNNIEGDQGIPVLGAGSREAEIQAEESRFYEHYLASRLSRGPTTTFHGVEFGPRISSTSFEVDNNIDTEALAQTRRQALDEGVRDVEIEASLAGPYTSHQTIMEHLRTDGADIIWEFLGGDLRFPQATITSPGERAPESEEVMTWIDVTFESRHAAGSPAVVIE